MPQQALPQMEAPGPKGEGTQSGRQLADFQRFHIELDKTKGFNTDVFFNYLCLSEEMGELGSELAKLWREQEAMVVAQRGVLSERCVTPILVHSRGGEVHESPDVATGQHQAPHTLGVGREIVGKISRLDHGVVEHVIQSARHQRPEIPAGQVRRNGLRAQFIR